MRGERRLLLEHGDLAAVLLAREQPGGRKPEDPSADDHDVQCALLSFGMAKQRAWLRDSRSGTTTDTAHIMTENGDGEGDGGEITAGGERFAAVSSLVRL